MSDWRILSVFLLMVLCGCSFLSSDSDGRIIAQIDSVNKSYTLDEETVIELRIKNVSSKTIYFSTCGSGTIHELTDSEITNTVVYKNLCYCICIFPIEPDEIKELGVPGYLIRNKNELYFSPDVEYRVLPHFYYDQELESRISLNAVEMSPVSIVKELK